MTKKTIAVIGANGQLGGDVVDAFASRAEVFPLTHEDVELSRFDSVDECLRRLRPDVVVNTAAMHNVEACELDCGRAFAVNAIGARNLAEVTRNLKATLVHISSDYVFDGRSRSGGENSPYTELDLPLPLNVYGTSKLAGENFVRTVNPRHIVLRTSALYGSRPCRAKGGKNFVDRMLQLGRERDEVRVVANERVSPTPTRELAAQMVALVEAEAYGLFHATSEGSCSWHEFACEIFSLARLSVRCRAAGSDEFPAKVARPAYSVLENAALKKLGINRFRDWREGLRHYLVQASGAVA